MNKPQSININNETVYSAEEIYKYDPSFFIGVARVRLIIEKKKLKENDELQIPIKAFVGMGDLELELEIAQGPQPPQDHPSPTGPGVVHCEPIETAHLHSFQVGCGPTDLLQALLKREGGLLEGVLQYGHPHTVEETAGPLDQIEMAQGEGIEAAGIEGAHGLGGRGHLPRVIPGPHRPNHD